MSACGSISARAIVTTELISEATRLQGLGKVRANGVARARVRVRARARVRVPNLRGTARLRASATPASVHAPSLKTGLRLARLAGG